MFVQAGFTWKNPEKLLAKRINHNIMWSFKKVNINVVVLKNKIPIYLVLFGLLLRVLLLKNFVEFHAARFAWKGTAFH
jgi:hypothetical protein